MAPFFNISFAFNFTSSTPLRLTIGWGGIFDWKGFEWNGILYPFTMFKILGSCVIFIQAPTKCFNLPRNGTSGILFDKNNLFISGWTFLDSRWIGFSEFISMLKKVYCELYVYTISLLLPPCLSIVGMTLLPLLLVAIMKIFRFVFVRKNFCRSHFLGACEGLNEKGFLCSIKISLVCFLGFDVVSNMVPKIFSD